jgi:hypothetical protein
MKQSSAPRSVLMIRPTILNAVPIGWSPFCAPRVAHPGRDRNFAEATSRGTIEKLSSFKRIA